MSRRTRSAGFAAAAALCAGLAAASTGEDTELAAEYGELREVVVAAEPLAAGRELKDETAKRSLELRRVPASFVPPDALISVEQALGRTPAATVPAGGYVLSSQLASAHAAGVEPAPPQRLDAGQRPVEIVVQAAGALADSTGSGGRVDVVVTSEPGPGGGAGRTYVAAQAVRLLELAPAAGAAPDEIMPQAASDSWTAVLALTRGQSLKLIHAESFARSVRLIES